MKRIMGIALGLALAMCASLPAAATEQMPASAWLEVSQLSVDGAAAQQADTSVLSEALPASAESLPVLAGCCLCPNGVGGQRLCPPPPNSSATRLAAMLGSITSGRKVSYVLLRPLDA